MKKHIIKKLVIALFCLVLMPNLKSQVVNCQPTGVSIELNNNCNNINSIYKARNKVSIKPGYRFQSTNNGVMKAKLDYSVVVPVTQSVEDNEDIVPETRELNTSFPVGFTKGVFNVSDIGAANYTIPLVLPSGINGVTPNVSISYNSNYGEGNMGYGWQIMATSSIFRVNKTIANDNISQIIQFNNDDAFAIDGQRLIRINNNLYVKQVNDLSMVVPNYQNNVIISFTITTKEGLVYEYGTSDDSRGYTTFSNNHPQEYFLKRTTDKKGNSVVYNYTNSLGGCTLLSSIEYTTNELAGIQAFNKIHFLYDKKDDENWSPKFFINGSEDRYSSVLLSEIRVEACGEIERKYIFKYNKNSIGQKQPGFYRLIEIIEKNKVNEQYNSLIFKWGIANEPIMTSSSTIDRNFTDLINNPKHSGKVYHRSTYGNFYGNGEKVEARVGATLKNWVINGFDTSFYYNFYVSLYNSSNISYSVTDLTSYVEYDNSTKILPAAYAKDYSIPNASDYTGDGIDDIVLEVNTPHANGWQKTIQFLPFQTIVDQSENPPIYSFSSLTNNPIPSYTCAKDNDVFSYTIDLNSDGLADFILFDKTDRKLNIRYSTLNSPFSSFFDLSSSLPPFNVFPLQGIMANLEFADFNGDGFVDILINYTAIPNNKSLILLGTNQNGIFNQITLQTEFDIQKTILLADFNNDGKTDIYSPEKGKFYFSTGIGNVITIEKAFSLPYQSQYKDAFILGDFNGDGKIDLATVKEDPSYPTMIGYECTTCFYSKTHLYFNVDFFNSKFTHEVFTNMVDYNTSGSKRLIYYNHKFQNQNYNHIEESDLISFSSRDANNDGVDDIIYNTINTDVANLSGYNKYYVETIFNYNNTYPTKIVEIADGHNNFLKIDYKQILNEPITSSTINYPIINYAPSLPYVYLTKTKISDNNQWNTTYYSFKGGKTHLQGKGFLGFCNISNIIDINEETYQNNSINYIQLIKNQTYSFENPYYIPLLTQETTQLKPSIITNQGSNAYNNGFTVSQTNYNFQIQDLNNGSFIPYLLNQTSSNSTFDSEYNSHISTQSQTEYEYDLFMNVEKITTTSEDATNVQEFENFQLAGGIFPHKPAKIKTTNTLLNQPSTYIEQNFTWDNTNGNLLSQSTPPGAGDPTLNVPDENQLITKTFEYYPTGNIKKETISATGITNSNITSYEYDNKFRFPTKATNALGHTVSKTYDNFYGNVLTEKDINGLTTQYKYDSFGRLTETIMPNGKKTTVNLRFVNNPTIAKTYYVETKYENSNPALSYFDAFGREMYSETVGFGNITYRKSNYYDKFGRLIQTRSNGPNNERMVVQNYFDRYGRNTDSKTFVANGNDPVDYQEITGTPVQHVKMETAINQNQLIVTTKNGITNEQESQYINKTGMLTKAIDKGGNEIVYEYNSNGAVKSITANSNNTIIEYDKYGRQILLVDPDAGNTSYSYNAYNQIVKQIDAALNEQILQYDRLGRVVSTTLTPNQGNAIQYQYVYDTKPNGKGKLATATGGENNSTVNYTYDALSRPTQTSEAFEGFNFSTKYTYDEHGRVSSLTYPNNYKINYQYDNATNVLTHIKDPANQNIWQLSETNKMGVPSKSILGNGAFEKNGTWSSNLTLESMSFKSTFGSNQYENKWIYDFEAETGNLLSRQNIVTTSGSVNIASRNLTESFEYDDFHRLTQVNYPNNVTAYEIGYNDNGTINYQKFFENQYNYTYNSAIPVHAPKQIDPVTPAEAIPLQAITYTPFKKVKNIKQGDENFQTDFNELIVSYGIDNERRKTIETKTENGNITYTRTKFFASNYELIQTTQNSSFEEKEILYIFAPDGLFAINETKNAVNKMYYISTDHLGSINLIVDGSNGNVVDDLSYDAWGRNRNPVNWTYSNITLSSVTDRGYTSHEQLPSFGLINMNGRVYDPMTLGFLSPDPVLQNPSNSQNYNRYSYCLNNPLKYTDPSGYNYSCYIDGLKISYNTFRNYMNWMSSEQKELFEKFEYTRDPNNRSDFNFTIQNDEKTNTYYSKHKNHNGFWVEWDGQEKIPDNELLSLGFKSNYNYTYARYTQFFEFDLFNWGGGDDLYAKINNASSLAGIGLGIQELSLNNNMYWLGKNFKYYSKTWFGNQWTGSQNFAIGLAKPAKILGRVAFGVNLIYGGYNVVSGIANGEYSKAMYSSLGIYYSAIATFGGIPGLVIAGPMVLIDATIGLDNYWQYSVNMQIDRANRVRRGDYSMIWYTPGRTIR